MSYRQPGPEARARYIEKSRELWAEHVAVERELRESGVEYADILKDSRHRDTWLRARQHDNSCPECGGQEVRMENYSMAWHEADIVCDSCDTYIRMWDAG